MKLFFPKIWLLTLSVLNIIWKLALIAIGVAAVFFTIFLYGEIKQEKLRGGEKLGSYVKEYDRDGYKSLYNEREKKFTLDHLDWVSHGVGEDEIGVYCKNGWRGFYNYNTGKPLTDPIYNRAWNFSEGLGAVESEGMVGFVDKDMNMVITPNFKIVRPSDDWPDAIQFKNSQCVIHLTPNSIGVIDRNGVWVIPPVFQSISDLSMDSCRVVERDGYYGVVDYDGSYEIEPQYDAVLITNPNVALVAKDGYQKQITYSGRVLLDFVYDDVTEFEPEHPKYQKYEVNWRFGVLDKKTGQPIVPAIYDDVKFLSSDKFLCKLPAIEPTSNTALQQGGYIIIDSNNRKISER